MLYSSQAFRLHVSSSMPGYAFEAKSPVSASKSAMCSTRQQTAIRGTHNSAFAIHIETRCSHTSNADWHANAGFRS